MIRFVQFIGVLCIGTVGCMAAGLVLAWAMHKAKPHCQRCGRGGPVARCYVCGLWLCERCKAHPGLCPRCWNTKDGMEADRVAQKS